MTPKRERLSKAIIAWERLARELTDSGGAEKSRTRICCRCRVDTERSTISLLFCRDVDIG